MKMTINAYSSTLFSIQTFKISTYNLNYKFCESYRIQLLHNLTLIMTYISKITKNKSYQTIIQFSSITEKKHNLTVKLR